MHPSNQILALRVLKHWLETSSRLSRWPRPIHRYPGRMPRHCTEHITHVCDTRCVPGVLVEGNGILKHPLHVRDSLDGKQPRSPRSHVYSYMYTANVVGVSSAHGSARR